MMSGDTCRTTSYKIEYWWPFAGPRDMQLGGQVGSWIAKNTKVLDKQRAPEVVKLIREQFPHLELIEARHAQLQHARWQK